MNPGEKKKKKKKKSKKKKSPGVQLAPGVKQSDPPRVPVSKFYPNGVYPEGEIHEYKNE